MKNHALIGAFAAGGQVTLFIAQLLGTVLIARMVGPEEFGLYAMVAVVVQFVRFFRDIGITKAIIQAKSVSSKEVSNLFWICLGICICLSLMMLTTSSFISDYYQRSEVELMLNVMAAVIAVEGLGLQHRALLQREIKVVTLFLVDFSSVILGVSAGLYVAWQGGGYWALISVTLVGVLIRVIFLWLVVKWRPELPALKVGVQNYLHYGGYLFFNNIVIFFVLYFDQILIGKLYGAYILGFYSYAFKLLILPVQQLNAPLLNVVLPLCARLRDSGGDYMECLYGKVDRILSFTLPGIGVMYLCSPSVFVFFMGYEWYFAASIFQLLTPAAICLVLNIASGWVFLIEGKTRDLFNWSACSTPFLMLGIWGALYLWGLAGVALFVSCSMCVLRFLHVIYASKKTSLSRGRAFGIISRRLVPMLCAVFIVLQLEPFLTDNYALSTIVVLVYLLLFAIVDFLLNRSMSTFCYLKGVCLRVKIC